MRIVVFEGTKLDRYRCEVCGQVELHSADETNTCLNCGCLMVKDPVKAEEEKPQEKPQEKPKRKGGRPRKAQPGTCAMCKNALRNNTGYTCEIDWQSHAGSETCPNHKDGVPVD